jgi:hypothetical protein
MYIANLRFVAIDVTQMLVVRSALAVGIVFFSLVSHCPLIPQKPAQKHALQKQAELSITDTAGSVKANPAPMSMRGDEPFGAAAGFFIPTSRDSE